MTKSAPPGDGAVTANQPPAPAPAPTPKRMTLKKILLIGVGSSVAVLGLLIYLFAMYETNSLVPWLKSPGINQQTWFEIIRNAVTTAAALGVGVSLFLSYRRQDTAEEAQRIAAEAQNVSSQALTLANQAHDLDRDRRSDDSIKALRDRYSLGAEQLGSDKLAVAIAGAHSLDSLADEWDPSKFAKERQDCVSLLCSYLRLTPTSDAVGTSVKPLVLDLVLNHMKSGTASVRYWDLKVDLTNQAPEHISDLLVDGAQLQLDGITAPPGDSVTVRRLEVRAGRLTFEDLDLSHGSLLLSDSSFEGGEITFSAEERADRGGISFVRCAFKGSAVSIPYGVAKALSLHFEDCSFEGGTFHMGSFCHPELITFERCRFENNIFLSEDEEHRGFDYAQIKVDSASCTFKDGLAPLITRPALPGPQLRLKVPFFLNDDDGPGGDQNKS